MALVKHNNNSISAVTSMASLSSGAMTLIKEQTASGADEVDFNDGSSGVVLDSTYPIYLFKYINIHPTSSSAFATNLRTGSSGSYSAATKTTTFFSGHHYESDSSASLAYSTGNDLAQSTGDHVIAYAVNTNNDDNVSGEMLLFNPSSTTFVKHFMTNSNSTTDDGGVLSLNAYTAGYANTTSAITSVRFKMVSGQFDGTIKLYGIKDS